MFALICLAAGDLMKRRTFIALSSVAFISACSGVKPYADAPVGNLKVDLRATESNWWTQRGVALDIYTGPAGPNMTYLGTRDIEGSGDVIGLPTGQDLHLILVFEEGSFLGNYDSAQSIQLPMKAFSRNARWTLTVSHTRIGFDYDMKRTR